MDALYVTEKAAAVVMAALRDSAVADPVVGLGSETIEVRSRAATLAYRRGASHQELLRIALQVEPAELVPRLKPIIYRRADIPSDCLFEAQGIAFCFPPMLILQMSGWTLDYSDAGSLVLIDTEGQTIVP